MGDEEKWAGTGYAEVAKALQGVTVALWMCAIACLIIPGWQIYIWLRYGLWVPLTNAEGMDYIGAYPVRSSWAGVQTMIDWWLAQSLAGWLFAGFLALGFGMLWLSLLADSAELALKHKWIDDGWKRKNARRPPDPAA